MNWQTYSPVKRGLFCVEQHPHRKQPTKGHNCGQGTLLWSDSYGEEEKTNG